MLDRDRHDHVRFCPIQSRLAQRLCAAHGAPADVSTAVLIDEAGAHTKSTAVLRLFPWMGFPFSLLGRAALLLPAFLRDGAYGIFAKNRGAFWRAVKQTTGWGDTRMEPYRDRIVGLEEEGRPLPESWGFDEEEDQDARSER